MHRYGAMHWNTAGLPKAITPLIKTLVAIKHQQLLSCGGEAHMSPSFLHAVMLTGFIWRLVQVITVAMRSSVKQPSYIQNILFCPSLPRLPFLRIFLLPFLGQSLSLVEKEYGINVPIYGSALYRYFSSVSVPTVPVVSRLPSTVQRSFSGED